MKNMLKKLILRKLVLASLTVWSGCFGVLLMMVMFVAVAAVAIQIIHSSSDLTQCGSANASGPEQMSDAPKSSPMMTGPSVLPAAYTVGLVSGPLGAKTAQNVALESGNAANSIPTNYVAYYKAAGAKYGIPWSVLAGVGKLETDHGRSKLPGVTSGRTTPRAARCSSYRAPGKPTQSTARNTTPNCPATTWESPTGRRAVTTRRTPFPPPPSICGRSARPQMPKSTLDVQWFRRQLLGLRGQRAVVGQKVRPGVVARPRERPRILLRRRIRRQRRFGARISLPQRHGPGRGTHDQADDLRPRPDQSPVQDPSRDRLLPA